jgi:hypothetical protein
MNRQADLKRIQNKFPDATQQEVLDMYTKYVAGVRG